MFFALLLLRCEIGDSPILFITMNEAVSRASDGKA